MFIVRHKATQFDGTAPAIQYGQLAFASVALVGARSQSNVYFLSKKDMVVSAYLSTLSSARPS
jgi:hypothetical protein